MKTFTSGLLLIMLLACGAPSETQAQVASSSLAKPVVSFVDLMADFKTWWQYHYSEVDLTTDFLPFDSEGNEIPKLDFLKALTSGEYITIQLASDAPRAQYQLFAFDQRELPAISATLKSVAGVELKRYQMEGREFPPFAVEDLEGKTYDNQQLRDKYTVIKTWFIACKPCIVEFPDLNELVASYADRESVQFLSLALDDKEELITFLEKKPFAYSVVADQRELIQKELHLGIYPTHLVVGPDGKIIKVVGKVERLRAFLKTL